MEITKEFIEQLLELVNKQADSKIRSKQGYGRFSIVEYEGSKDGRQVCMELWYKPTDSYLGFNELLLRKCYDLTVDHLEVFQSVFYQEVINVLTGSEKSVKLVQYGKDSLNR